jgi:hypothetical protein
MAFAVFVCRFHVAHISPTRTSELNGHHQRGWNAYIRGGGTRCPEGIVYDTAVISSVPCSLRQDASHLDLRGSEPCSPSLDVTTLHDENA